MANRIAFISNNKTYREFFDPVGKLFILNDQSHIIKISSIEKDDVYNWINTGPIIVTGGFITKSDIQKNYSEISHTFYAHIMNDREKKAQKNKVSILQKIRNIINVR